MQFRGLATAGRAGDFGAVADAGGEVEVDVSEAKRFTVGSLFSGAGGFDIGFHRAGFDVRWQVEIDATARAVLAKHWPDVERHEDVRKVGKRNLAPVDVIVGGFPCQDLSVAGKRAGFAGARSSLFFEMARVIRELRPAYVCWENVPGLLSSEEGRDFLAVLVELGGLGFDGGWRTVDAQFFGVPQQRRRVFGVFARGRAGAERCAEVLALREGGTRRTPKGRKKGKGVAATLTRGSGKPGVNPPGRRQEDDTNLVVAPETRGNGVGTERLGDTRGQDPLVVFGDFAGHGGYAEAENVGAQRADGAGGDATANLVLAMRTAQTGANGIGVSERAHTLDRANGQAVVIPIDMRQASRGETMTNNRAEGSSGGAPGTGIGEAGDPSPTIAGSHTPAVFCIRDERGESGRGGGVLEDVAYPLHCAKGMSEQQAVCVTGTTTHTLTREGADASEDGTGRGTPIVFNWQSGGDCRLNPSELPDAQSVGQTPALHVGSLVRRLTPRECERLMGWPDDWTRWRGDETEIKDGPRYRLCGNGVVGTVAEWLARRLMAVIQEEA